MTANEASDSLLKIIGRATISDADYDSSLTAIRVIRETLDDAAKFKNGIDNLIIALDEAPGLPIELLSEEDQAKWTNTITGVLMALGPYRITGRPQSVWEYVQAEARP